MKKIISLSLLVLVLISCSDKNISNIDVDNKSSEVGVNQEQFIVWWKQNNSISIYWNIINNNIKTLSSKINWKISYLECESWKKVNHNTLISKVSPDNNDLSYKNNLIQLNSLKEQLQNQKNIRTSTVLNFDSQLRQINLKKEDLNNQIKVLWNNLWASTDTSSIVGWIEKQIVLLNDSEKLLISNKEQSIKDIDDSINNIKWNIFNTATTALKRLDETFWVSDDNKNTNNSYDDYLWAKNTSLKNEVISQIRLYINKWYKSKDDLLIYNEKELSNGLDELSKLLKKAATVLDESIPSQPSFSDTVISGLYSEFIWYSNAILWLKTNFDKLINGKQTSILTFDWKLKEIEQAKENINIQKNNLSWTIDSSNISLKNIDEQISNLEESKKSTLKQIDMQIINMNEWISRLNLMFETNSIYAWINWTIKVKNAKLWNSVWIWVPICTIVPENNSLKLEIYSPEPLKIGDTFEYYKNNILLWEWVILSENPTKNSQTQNYIYEWKIDFSLFKEWDYIDVKVKNELLSNNSELWIPLIYVKPKLDWYYVNIKSGSGISEEIKIEVGNMNNWEIRIISWLNNWDILFNK